MELQAGLRRRRRDGARRLSAVSRGARRGRGGLPAHARVGGALPKRAYPRAGPPLRDRAGRNARGPAPPLGGGARGRSTFPATRSAASPSASRRRRSATITAFSAPLLPDGPPRYLMGVGTPADLLASVRAGVDLFDCVLPTRNGRMGHAYTSRGRGRDQARAVQGGPAPLDPACACPVCRRHSRAYLRNLFVAQGFLGADAAVDPQRLLLPRLDADDPRGDRRGTPRRASPRRPRRRSRTERERDRPLLL